MTQKQLILAHLERGRTLTPLQALTQFGCLRLAARVCELRNDGYLIKMEIVRGKGKQFAKYWM